MSSASQLQLRRGTAAQVAAFTGAEGEVTPDLTNNRLVLHDGLTAGGHPQASEAMVTAAIAAAGVSLIIPPQARLTLSSGVDVMTSSVANADHLRLTPHGGNRLPINDAGTIVMKAFSEISVALSDTTKNPAAIGANKINDWFVWDDAGTLRLTHSVDWTDLTTKSAGAALRWVAGIPFNDVDIANGPAAGSGTHVGTTWSNGAGGIDFIFGGVGAGGVAAFFGVWNAFNRRPIATAVRDNTAGGWTYALSDVRAANGSTGNRVSFVAGLPTEGVKARYQGNITLATAAGAYARNGLALDSVSALDSSGTVYNNNASAAFIGTPPASMSYGAMAGGHFIQATEVTDGSHSATYNGAGGLAQSQGLEVELWA